jgi:hypothetical protein
MNLAELWTTIKWRWQSDGLWLGLCAQCGRPIWPWQPAVNAVTVDKPGATSVFYHSICWEAANPHPTSE